MRRGSRIAAIWRLRRSRLGTRRAGFFHHVVHGVGVCLGFTRTHHYLVISLTIVNQSQNREVLLDGPFVNGAFVSHSHAQPCHAVSGGDDVAQAPEGGNDIGDMLVAHSTNPSVKANVISGSIVRECLRVRFTLLCTSCASRNACSAVSGRKKAPRSQSTRPEAALQATRRQRRRKHPGKPRWHRSCPP